ncbi:uncharacterized protein EV420DRAFT_1146595 [Desarmillaria tabescens]|uniref:F-box domain-containing protein n=1 Tax=Armillaria tabescens TaxID=1929756 RepID=A0AA39NC97_ARMTA|nr:uncharacterized protein EV420DRAFT_1146595 [Desarmillaria tabescens]KAK0462954.1 hypothetical protein EV420DRAFT_1146595 [Desarmillaria tabescens]
MAKRKEDRDLEPAPNSLAGLPTELLVIIVSDLVTRRDLFSLARVCRRLNDVAMTCWLRSRTLKRYSTFSPGWPMPFSTFADLRLCFATKPHIPSMTLTFGTQYIKEYEEFSRYVDTIPSDRTCPILHIKLHMPRFPIDTRAFNAFCTELTEYNSVASFQVIQQSGERVHMSLRDTKGPNHQPIFHPPPFTTLTELHIQSVSKQLDDWLLRSVAASPICNLTILDNASLPYGRICLPTIRKLTLGDRTMTTSQLIQFLSDEAHSSLRELTFMPKAEPYWEIPVKGRLIPLSMNAMPSLTSLAAEFKVLTNLLVTPEAFPKLERVEVYGIGSNESSAAEDGAELLTRIMSLPSVHCVTFPVGALESGDWDNLSGSGIVLPNVIKLIDQWSLRAPSILSQVRKVFPNVVGVDSPSQSQA